MTVDLRLAIPAAAAWIAAGLFVAMPSLSGTIALWVLAGTLTALALRFRSWAVVALSAAAAAVCCSSIVMQAPGRLPEILTSAADSGRVVLLSVTATETIHAGQDSFDVRVDSVRAAPVSVPARVFGDAATVEIGIGSTLELSATVTTTVPGDDMSFLLFAESNIRVTSPPPWYLDWANALRATMRAASDGLPGAGGDLLPGLAIGDTSAVDDELDEAMKASALSHLTAVSGANCAVVIGLIMAAGAAMGLARSLRIGASVAVLIAFVVLVTPEPSVLRAAVMAALVLAASLSGRPARGLPILALAVLVLLILDPWLARNYGFVLSVLATGGLLLLAGPLADVFARWMPRWLALVIAVPVAAQLACQPVIILLNATIPSYGVLANVLAAPAAPIATVVGLAACVLLTLVPVLGQALCLVAWLPSSWIAAVAQFFATLPGAQLPWPEGWLGVGLLAAVSSFVGFAVHGRRWAALCLAATLVGYATIAGGSELVGHLGRPTNWQIAACDVGQGDAIVVRSEGQVALFDTGPDPAALEACLADLAIGRIDLLVLTHFHLDHYGGISAIAGRVDVALVGPSSGESDDAIVESLRAAGADVREVRAGPSGLLGDLRWNVLWPPRSLSGIELGNPSSIVISLESVGDCVHGCLSSVFLGDLGESAQSRLLRSKPLGEFDVVKVAHHGSADQNAELYSRFSAVVGIVCVGEHNGYGHPARSLLDILDHENTSVARTDERGLILLAPGGSPGTVRVWSER